MDIDYTKLAHSDNGIPTTDAVLGIVLKLTDKKKTINRASLIKSTIQSLALPKDLLSITLSDGKAVIYSRVDWAITILHSAGLLNRPSRGNYIISDKGKEFWAKYELNLPRNVVLSETDTDNSTISRQKDENDEELLDQLTLEDIKEWHTQQFANFQDKLLKYLRGIDPHQFEKLMVHLLEVMGYRSPNGQAITTQQTRDGGIDGVIQQDALGLQNVYIQVKRYAESNSIDPKTIRSFGGVLQEKKNEGDNNNGVFITTSSYTSDALESAKRLHIKTIDGEQLTKLMIKYKVGVKVINLLPVYEIDKDDFQI